jgi:23S rRNA (uridine2552-2'-O)-methyltransferase
MSKTSRAWIHRHINDPYVKKSVQDGYRSRAAYKLLELDQRDRIFRPGQRVIDLGAAPGGWSQVARERVGSTGQVVGIDLLPMGAIAGVTLLQADFMTEEGLSAVQAAMAEARADVVLSDMAPNMSGQRLSDQARHFELAAAALDFAADVLGPDGIFVVKVFQGAEFEPFVRACRAAFVKVAGRKPDASRAESHEQYLIARGRRSASAADRMTADPTARA